MERWGEQLGTPMQLPASYVREHLSLGYAGTRDSAQGGTVDTAHSVPARDRPRAGAYVPGTRGRETNVLFVVTRNVGDTVLRVVDLAHVASLLVRLVRV